MVLDYVGYSSLLEKYVKVHFEQESREDFACTPSNDSSRHEVSQFDLTCMPNSSSSSSTPQSTPKASSISSVMLQHKSYPERRPGRSPKRLRTALDRIFSLPSKKFIQELQKQKNVKESKKTGSYKRVNTSTHGRSTTSPELLPPASPELLCRGSPELLPPVYPIHSESSDAESVTKSRFCLL